MSFRAINESTRRLYCSKTNLVRWRHGRQKLAMSRICARKNAENAETVRRVYSPKDIWELKPIWCQPWSILLTGSSIIVAPASIFHNPLISGMLLLPVFCWWYVFLLIYPQQLANALNSESNEEMDFE